MIGRQRTLGVVIGAVLGVVVFQAPATGQRAPQACQQNVPFLIIPWIGAADTKMSLDARRAMFEASTSMFRSSELCVLRIEDINSRLTGSGYPADKVLSVLDNRALAQDFRADQFFMIDVKKSGSDYQFSGAVYLTRDEHIYEPIPTAEAAGSMSQAASRFVEQMKIVFKELPHEQKCFNMRRDGKYAEAEAEARAGIAVNANSVISRVCLANALHELKKSADVVGAAVDDVLKRQPDNYRMLGLQLNLYYEKGDTNNYAKLGGKYAAMDPSSSDVETIVQNLADWKRGDIALPIIETALQADPDNPNLNRLHFRLLYAAGKWKEIEKKGESMLRTDSSYADTLFFQRLASAYAQDSQLDKVAATLQRATKKFPTNVDFSQKYAAALNATGQQQQAIGEYERLLKVAPNTPALRLRIANAYNTLNQPDSAIAWLRTAYTAGDDKATVAGVALQIGQAMQKVAATAHSIPDLERAVGVIAFSDSVNTTQEAQFLWGFSAYTIGALTLQAAQAAPTCDAMKKAKEQFDIAAPKLTAGGRVAPQVAGDALNNINGQYGAYATGMLRQLKCGS